MLALLLAVATHTPAIPVFRDVAPILYKHCATCHHEGEVAPFPLITYEDARKRAKLVAEVTRTRLMPPWRPVGGYNHFANERRLTEAQIQTLQRWAAAGTPEGKATALPPTPTFDAGWKLGTPDLIVEFPKPFDVPAEGADVYECFVIPMNAPRNRFIRAVEFRPAGAAPRCRTAQSCSRRSTTIPTASRNRTSSRSVSTSRIRRRCAAWWMSGSRPTRSTFPREIRTMLCARISRFPSP